MFLVRFKNRREEFLRGIGSDYGNSNKGGAGFERGTINRHFGSFRTGPGFRARFERWAVKFKHIRTTNQRGGPEQDDAAWANQRSDDNRLTNDGGRESGVSGHELGVDRRPGSG